MGIDCGFDIYPPLRASFRNQAKYEAFQREVLAAYGLNLDGEQDSAPGSDVVQVNPESENSYITFMVGEWPAIPRHCENFLRFSSKLTSRLCPLGHIYRVCKIAKQNLGDRVYFWHEGNEFSGPIRQRGVYNWVEVQAARRRANENHKLIQRGTGEQTQERQLRGHSDEFPGDEAGSIDIPTSLTLVEKCYSIQPLPGKGHGLVATLCILKGTRLLQEEPMFKMPASVEDSFAAEALVLRKVKSLSRDRQRAFFGLQNIHGKENTPLLGIARTNMLPLSGADEDKGGMFEVASRINHSCRPNAQHSWNEALGCMTVHALRDIAAGEEVTISYMRGLAMGYAQRQRHLDAKFSFTCGCELCSLPLPELLVSDARLSKIASIFEDLEELAVSDIGQARKDFEQTHQLIQLLKYEGICDISFSRAYFAAFQIAIAVGDKARAQVLARRAYSVRRVFSGGDNPMTAFFERLAERPVEHPLFRTAEQCWVDTWEAPCGMQPEEFENWLRDTNLWGRK